MVGPFAKYDNGNGTFNGVGLLAELSGLSQAEVKWTWDRLQHLMHVEKKTKSEARAIVKAEAAAKPWVT